MTSPGLLAHRIQEPTLYALLLFLPFAPAAVEVCFGILLIAWVIERLDPRTRAETVWRRPELRSTAWAIIGFIGIVALSIPGSQFPEISVSGFIGKWVEYVLMCVVAADLGCRPGVLMRSAIVLACSSVLVVLEGLSQEIWGRGLIRGKLLVVYGRMTGPYTNPIDLGVYLMVVFPIMMTRMVPASPRARRWLGCACLAVLLALARTIAFGVWLAFAAALCVVALRLPRLRRALAVAALVGVVAAGAILHHTGLTSSVLSLKDVGTQDRIAMWTAGWHMFLDRPLLGHGVNTFMSHYLSYWVGGEQAPRYAHNCYLQMAAETGLFGLGAFLWLLWSVMRLVWRRMAATLEGEGILLLGLCAALIAFLLHAGIDTDFYALRQAALFWILAGASLGLSVRLAPVGPAAAPARGRQTMMVAA